MNDSKGGLHETELLYSVARREVTSPRIQRLSLSGELDHRNECLGACRNSSQPAGMFEWL